MAPEVNLAPVQTVDNTTCSTDRCDSCGKRPSTIRRKKKPTDCGPVQIQLGRQTANRKHLRALIKASKLPQREFAEYVLGVDEATVYRYLHGSVIPHSKAVQFRNIVHLKREGTYLQLTIKTCAERPRWRTMLIGRDRESSV